MEDHSHDDLKIVLNVRFAIDEIAAVETADLLISMALAILASCITCG